MEVVEGFALLKGTRLKKKLRQVQIKYRGICSGLVEEQTQKYILSTPWQPVNVSKNTHCQNTVDVNRRHVSPSSLSLSQWYPSIMEYFLSNNIHYKNIAYCYKVPAYAVFIRNLQLKIKTFFLFQNHLTSLIYPMNQAFMMALKAITQKGPLLKPLLQLRQILRRWKHHPGKITTYVTILECLIGLGVMTLRNIFMKSEENTQFCLIFQSID